MNELDSAIIRNVACPMCRQPAQTACKNFDGKPRCVPHLARHKAHLDFLFPNEHAQFSEPAGPACPQPAAKPP